MIDKGVDVLYAERFGVSDAARERGVLAIGNVIDTQPQYPDTVVASALWHMEPTVSAAIAAVRAGSSWPGLRQITRHSDSEVLRWHRWAPSRRRSPPR